MSMERGVEATDEFMNVSQELATDLLAKNEMNEAEKKFFSDFTIVSLDMYLNRPDATSLFDLLKSAQNLSFELMQKDTHTDLEQRFIRAITKISLAVLLHQKDCSKRDNKEERDNVNKECDKVNKEYSNVNKECNSVKH